MKEKYLTIGTVLQLKNGTKKVMIVGFCPIANDGSKFVYIGSLYPEGLDSKKSLLFNHDQIGQIFNEGYTDEEDKEFLKKLKEVMSKKNNE